MAAIKHLISQSRITSFPLTHLLRSHTSYRSLCSQIDSQPPPNPNPNPNPNESQSQPEEPSRFPQPVVPQSISYPVKPKPEQQDPDSNQNPQFQGQNDGENVGMWSREDFRYVKDIASTVSYPSRVAPLPEDRKYESYESEESLEMRKRASEERVRKRVFKIYEDEKLPFPTLIKQEGEKTTKEKVVYDLKEAIHLLKVCV